MSRHKAAISLVDFSFLARLLHGIPCQTAPFQHIRGKKMTGNRVIVGFLLALTFLVVSSLASQAAYYPTRPGTIYYLEQSLSAGDTTTLDRMVVKTCIGNWIFVREPWSSSETLAVYAPGVEIIKPWTAIEVTGVVTIAGRKKVIRATGLRYYVDKLDRPMWLLPMIPVYESWQDI
jgi:hypothetical protein